MVVANQVKLLKACRCCQRKNIVHERLVVVSGDLAWPGARGIPSLITRKTAKSLRSKLAHQRDVHKGVLGEAVQQHDVTFMVGICRLLATTAKR